MASDLISALYFSTAGILVAYIHASIPNVQILRATTGVRSPVEMPVMIGAMVFVLFTALWWTIKRRKEIRS